MPDAPDDPVEVYRGRGSADAHAVRLLLDAEGIPARVDGEFLQGATGELPLGWGTAPRVLVAQRDADAARAVVAGFAWRTDPAAPAGELRCLACGEPMGATVACPACGWSYLADVAADREPEPATDAPAAAENREPPADAPPPAAVPRSELWAEVAAVLAVGVVPYLLSAVVSLRWPAPPLPHWADALYLIASGGCAIYVTLYLIRRSGDGWPRFGLTRLTPLDALGGAVLLFVAVVLDRLVDDIVPAGPAATSPPTPREAGAFALMATKYAVSAFAEELVTRAYLLTRLEVLLRSATAAVVVAAAAFASYHAYQGYGGVAYSFAFGLAYGLAFLVIRRVWPLAIGHALFNIRLDVLAVG